MDNRSAILEQSLRLFSLHGYDAVGVQEVADSVSVTKPTLYHYFGSKRGLLEAILSTGLEPLLRGLELDCRFDHNLVMNLRSASVRLFSTAKENPALLRLLLSSHFAPIESELAQAARPWNARILSLFVTLFREATVDHGNMRGREALHGASFLGTVYAYVSQELSGDLAVDEELSRLVVKTFMHGIMS